MSSDKNQNTHPESGRFDTSNGVRRHALTVDNVYDYALAKLGAPVVNVEIEKSQLQILLQDTLDEYSKWCPHRKIDVLRPASSSINRYNLRELNKPYGRGIVDLAIVTKERFFAPIAGVFALGIPHPISHLSPDQYDLALRYINAAKKVYSSEPEWEWSEPMLWIYAPTGFGGPFDVAYVFHQDVTSPEEVMQEDYTWFKRYFAALVKEVVGEARAKFSGIPGPAGQNLRGQEMIQEAREDMEKLRTEIEGRSYSRAPPLWLGGKG